MYSPRRSMDDHHHGGDGGAGDLGVSIPAPHMLEGSSYPTITSPSSYAGSSNGRSNGGRSSRARARNSLPQQSHSPHPGIGTYSLQAPQAQFAQGPSSDVTSSSRKTRRSLPPPQSYAYATSPPPLDYHQATAGGGYGGGGVPGGGYGYGEQEAQDLYAMPEYLYSPQPHPSGSVAPPSVSSGASASSTHRTRNDGIFAVAAPHHSQGPRPRSSYPSHSTLQLQYQHHHHQQQQQQQMYQHSQPSGHGMTVGDVLPAFPPWSMAWYAGHVSADGHAYTTVPPQGSGAGDWESDTLTSSGYPAYPHHYRPYPVPPGPYPYGPHPHPPSSPRSSLARDAAPLDPEAQAAALKAARLRALEREFGLKVDGHHATGDNDDDDLDDDDALGLLGGEHGDEDDKGDGDENEDDHLPPGSVTSDGRYVHHHPRMRKAVGWALLLLSLFTFAIGAGGSYLIKIAPPVLPSSAPAKGTIGSYALYVLSFFCLAISFYLVCIRPCCVEPVRRRRVAGMVGNGGVMGMPGGLVVPVLTNGGSGGGGGGLFGGSKNKMPKGMPMPMPMPPGGGRRGLFGRKKGGQGMMGPAPTVNLIVDPRAMMGGGAGLGGAADLGSDEDDDSSDDEETQAEKRALAARPENADLAGLLGRSTAAAIGAPAGAAPPLTKKQRKRQRRAARLRRRDLAARRAAFVPLVLASLKTQTVWLCVQSLCWLLAVFACLIPLFRSTASTTVSFTDAGTGETFNRTLQYNRTALGGACLPRGGGGWCDAYNGARAGSVISLVVCLLLAGWAMREHSLAKTLARREGAGFRVR